MSSSLCSKSIILFTKVQPIQVHRPQLDSKLILLQKRIFQATINDVASACSTISGKSEAFVLINIVLFIFYSFICCCKSKILVLMRRYSLRLFATSSTFDRLLKKEMSFGSHKSIELLIASINVFASILKRFLT